MNWCPSVGYDPTILFRGRLLAGRPPNKSPRMPIPSRGANSTSGSPNRVIGDEGRNIWLVRFFRNSFVASDCTALLMSIVRWEEW